MHKADKEWDVLADDSLTNKEQSRYLKQIKTEMVTEEIMYILSAAHSALSLYYKREFSQCLVIILLF